MLQLIAATFFTVMKHSFDFNFWLEEADSKPGLNADKQTSLTTHSTWGGTGNYYWIWNYVLNNDVFNQVALTVIISNECFAAFAYMWW